MPIQSGCRSFCRELQEVHAKHQGVPRSLGHTLLYSLLWKKEKCFSIPEHLLSISENPVFKSVSPINSIISIRFIYTQNIFMKKFRLPLSLCYWLDILIKPYGHKSRYSKAPTREDGTACIRDQCLFFCCRSASLDDDVAFVTCFRAGNAQIIRLTPGIEKNNGKQNNQEIFSQLYLMFILLKFMVLEFWKRFWNWQCSCMEWVCKSAGDGLCEFHGMGFVVVFTFEYSPWDWLCRFLSLFHWCSFLVPMMDIPLSWMWPVSSKWSSATPEELGSIWSNVPLDNMEIKKYYTTVLFYHSLGPKKTEKFHEDININGVQL